MRRGGYSNFARPKARKAPHQADKKAVEVCARKRRYPDELTARAMGTSRIEHSQDIETLYVYRCAVCSGWHLTRFKVGTPIKAGDPLADDWRAEILEIASAGPITTYRDCEHGGTASQKWLHEACLTLEGEGKLRRRLERESAVTWEAA